MAQMAALPAWPQGLTGRTSQEWQRHWTPILDEATRHQRLPRGLLVDKMPWGVIQWDWDPRRPDPLACTAILAADPSHAHRLHETLTPFQNWTITGACAGGLPGSIELFNGIPWGWAAPTMAIGMPIGWILGRRRDRAVLARARAVLSAEELAVVMEPWQAIRDLNQVDRRRFAAPMRQLYGRAVIDAAGVQEFLQGDELEQVLDSLRTISTAITALGELGVLDQSTREEIHTLLEGLRPSPDACAHAADVLDDLLDAAHRAREERHTLLSRTPDLERQLNQFHATATTQADASMLQERARALRDDTIAHHAGSQVLHQVTRPDP